MQCLSTYWLAPNFWIRRPVGLRPTHPRGPPPFPVLRLPFPFALRCFLLCLVLTLPWSCLCLQAVLSARSLSRLWSCFCLACSIPSVASAPSPPHFHSLPFSVTIHEHDIFFALGLTSAVQYLRPRSSLVLAVAWTFDSVCFTSAGLYVKPLRPSHCPL